MTIRNMQNCATVPLLLIATSLSHSSTSIFIAFCRFSLYSSNVPGNLMTVPICCEINPLITRFISPQELIEIPRFKDQTNTCLDNHNLKEKRHKINKKTERFKWFGTFYSAYIHWRNTNSGSYFIDHQRLER